MIPNLVTPPPKQWKLSTQGSRLLGQVSPVGSSLGNHLASATLPDVPAPARLVSSSINQGYELRWS
jgi:hypothetical protein